LISRRVRSHHPGQTVPKRRRPDRPSLSALALRGADR